MGYFQNIAKIEEEERLSSGLAQIFYDTSIKQKAVTQGEIKLANEALAKGYRRED